MRAGHALTCVTALRTGVHGLVVVSGFHEAPAIGRRIASAELMGTMAETAAG